MQIDTIPRTEGCARAAGRMSNWQRDLEHKTLSRYLIALAAFRSALQDIDTGSALVKVDLKAFDDFVHDELPSEASWEAKIAEAQ